MGRILSWTACLGVCLLQVPCAQAARIVVMATNSGSSTTSNSQPPSAVAGAKGFLIGIDNMTDPLGPLAFLNLSFSGPGLVQRLAPNAAAAEAFVTAPNVQQRSTAASANAFDPVAGSQFAANDSFWWNQNLNVNGQFYTLEPVQAGIQGGLPGGPMTMTGTYNLTGNVPAGIWPVAYIVTTSNLQVAGILASGGNQFGPWGPVGSMVQLNLDGPSYGTAVDTTWINPAGGSFGAGANWSAGQTPLPGNRTVFNLAETYAVSVASNTTTAFMRVQAGDVTLDLNGSTYTVAPFANGALGPPSNGVEVSSASGPAPTLRITDGNMVTDYGTYIGSSVGFDAPGAATIEAGATWTENSFFIVRKDSQLTIENGGALIVNSQHLSNYEFQSATGSTVILHKGSIDVPRAAFNSAATLHIGLGGTDVGEFGKLTVTNQASLRGTFNVDLLDGFMPALGDNFEVINFGTRDGDFATYQDMNLGGHLALQHTFTSTSLILKAMPAVSGDINLDGVVNIFDINTVSSNWDTAGPQGDANGDGIVNIFDINAISANWGATDPDPAQAVPEPATLVLACCGAGTMLVVARRRRIF